MNGKVGHTSDLIVCVGGGVLPRPGSFDALSLFVASHCLFLSGVRFGDSSGGLRAGS